MTAFKPTYFMLIPTMACQASCRYCFAKKQDLMMSRSTLERAIEYIGNTVSAEGKFHVVFHGGEPLLAGTGFLEYALAMLKDRFGTRVRLSIQSNLWALLEPEGDRLVDLLVAYGVSVGTSLDGFREMCDAQRGAGYYDKTTAAIEKLQSHGIRVSQICTFGKEYADQGKKVFEAAKGSYAVHGAVPSLWGSNSLTLTPKEMQSVQIDSYEAYRSNISRAHITTIDAMARACLYGKSRLCTFKRCLGHFAAIAPDGSIYSCQRFIGDKDFVLGNVSLAVTEQEICSSPAFIRLKTKQDSMTSACGDCPHVHYCLGGCLYNSFAGNTAKDPYCSAYRAVFNRIKRDMALEMAEELKCRMSGRECGNNLMPVLSMAKHGA